MAHPGRAEVEPGSATWWEAHGERLARRRPRAGGLTVERLVDEALRLVDAEGLDALTVRRLASRLDTSSATLYRHVASVDELLVLLIDRVLGEIELAPTDLPGRDKVVWVAFEFRRVLRDHPGVVPALRAAPLLGPNATRSAVHGLTSLLEAGLGPEVAVPGYLALIDFVLGSVFFDTAGHGGRHPGGRIDGGGADGPVGDGPVGDGPAGDGPVGDGPVGDGSVGDGSVGDGSVGDVFRRVFEGRSDDTVFRFGLETFLDGLALRAGGLNTRSMLASLRASGRRGPL